MTDTKEAKPRKRYYQAADTEAHRCGRCNRKIKALDVHWIEEEGTSRKRLCGLCSLLYVSLNTDLKERKRVPAAKGEKVG